MTRSTDANAWDICIVGASFAGAACALAAAQAGLRVCVLERKTDPGARLHTTGIIVREAAEQTWLGRAPATLLQRVGRVRLYAPGMRSLVLAAPGYYFLTTDTPGLMRWLVQELLDHGVDVRLGQRFEHARRSAGHWQIEGLGTARYLVGADGARSRVAECRGFARPHALLFGIEHEYHGLRLEEGDALHCFISKRWAPGYIGWAAQNPRGVQVGLAMRQHARRAPAPDIDGFVAHVGEALGLPRGLEPDAVRAGHIPCGGPLKHLTRPGVILTGDAAGIVSPVTAGGIHAAWNHGWRVGAAIATHLRHGGTAPEQAARSAVPRFRGKRLLRWAYDHFQMDWPFDLLLYTRPMRRAAELVYFHSRGVPQQRPAP